jgi:hypothetical protein
LKLEKLLLSLSFSIMLLFTIYSNSTYAQLARTIGIKITSPAMGQQIPVGITNLPISGTSAYNSTMSCQVSLIVDDVKPYQKAVAAHRGVADYSSWNYTLTPHYTTIKQGPNKLTAKLSCHDNSMNVTKFYSVNITGVTSSSNQAGVNTSKSTVANQTKSETGKAPSLPAKQNATTASTALQPTEQLPSTLTVNGILAKTGILVGTQQQAATQSDTNSTTAQHHRHHPTATTGKTGILATVSAEGPTPTTSNNTASNNTASNNTASNSTGIPTSTNGALGKVSIPTSTNGALGKVSIPPLAAAASAVNTTTVTNPEQHANITAPFFFASPSSSLKSALSSPSPASRFNNNPQSLQLPPIANAGSAQVVTAGSSVILNGSGSRAPSGIILSYSWNQMPTNAKITLSGVNTPVWEFTAPIVSADTLLRFQLTVTDNLGQTGTDMVNILDKPGSTFNAPVRTQIVKSPSVSANIPSISQNKGSNIVNIPTTNSTLPQSLTPPIPPPLTPPISPPLTPPINSRLAIQGNNGAQPLSQDHPPIANAGKDQVVNANSTVALVGSLSKDPDGDSISYHWTQISGSPAITLGGASTPVWEFTAPNVASDTTLAFQLTVTDSHGLSDSGRVNVLVKHLHP